MPVVTPARTMSPLATTRIAAAAAGLALSVAGLVATAAPASAASGPVWDAVAQCESSGNWSISTGNGYYGGLQFSSSTWRAFGGAQYGATANRATREQQIEIAQRVLAVQGPGAWPVCSRRAGLTRENGSQPIVDAPVEPAAPPVDVERTMMRFGTQHQDRAAQVAAAQAAQQATAQQAAAETAQTQTHQTQTTQTQTSQTSQAPAADPVVRDVPARALYRH